MDTTIKDTEHEIYWIDVFDSNTYVQKIDFVGQKVKWKYLWDYPGRQTVKKHFPSLNSHINRFNERNFIDVFEKVVEKFQPDVIQSFELHSGCSSIIDFMEKRKDLKWIYSAWGNDLFYYKNEANKLKNIKRILKRLDYMFADCSRDYKIASDLGFNGYNLGTFPGGGGYDLAYTNPMVLDFNEKKNYSYQRL